MKKSYSIIPVEEIPKGLDVPTDNLLDIFRICIQMEQICTAQEGIGLAAVQIGVPWRLFIVQRNSGYEYYVNCEYTGLGPKEKSIEGCLSLRDAQGNLRRFEVERHSKIAIKGKQLKVSNSPSLILEDVDRIEEGLFAVVMAHETDHASQITIDQIGREVEIISRK